MNPAEVTAIKAVRDGSNVRPFIMQQKQHEVSVSELQCCFCCIIK